jgi:hypothetical protein
MNSLHAVFNQMEQLNHSQLQAGLALPKVAITDEQRAIWQGFERYAAQHGIRAFPATPALAASYLAAVDESDLEKVVDALHTVHDALGLASPCGASLAVKIVLERRLRAEAPRSWSREDKQLWASLPIGIRQILSRRENERDAALRTKQNKLAAEMKRLAEAEPKKEVETNEQS